MGKSHYYIAMAILFVAIWFILAIVLMGIGAVGADYGGLGYRLGTAIGTPPLLFIALGITLLLRKVVYKKILGQNKDFSKALAVVCIFLGCIWLASTIGARKMSDYTKDKLMEYYQRNNED